jgi:hypothetical protein
MAATIEAERNRFRFLILSGETTGCKRVFALGDGE